MALKLLGASGVTAATLVVLVLRLVRDEDARAHTFPDNVRHAATTKRIVRFVY